jgi:tetratricopeptide (TPR) repeat protein
LEQASIALLNSQKIFKELEDDEMTATTLQDLGLCYYYQHRYQEAMALYTSACRVIVEKLGPCHVALACPAFNIANIMCAAGTYERAIDFYKIAYSINVQALGKVGRPSALLVTRSCHSVSLVLLAKPLY